MILERLRILTWAFVLLFAVVDVRLAHLQFVAHDFWDAEARSTREDGEYVPFRRGSLRDRYGKQLAVGEIQQTLNLQAYHFRRESPIGVVHAGLRFLAENGLRPDLVPPGIAEIVQQPEEHVRMLLSVSKQELGPPLPQSVAGDYGFYARRALGMSEKEFREARESSASDLPFADFAAGAVSASVERIRDQAFALEELAKAIGETRAELLFAIESKIEDVEKRIADAAAACATPPDAKQMRAFRRDHENRLQMLARGIPYKAVFLINMAPLRFTGIEVRDVDSRRYPAEYENLAPTLIGSVGDATAEVCEVARKHELRLRELESREPEARDDEMEREIYELQQAIRYEDYLPEEQLGRDGLEGVLEAALRGHRGWKHVRRDRARNDVELLDQKGAIGGEDVYLTLDADLQLACQRVLDQFHHEGAIVLLDPKDGAIRAMASWPSPTRKQLKDDYAKLVKDPSSPLFHRAYKTPGNPPPPGSVFKVIVAAAGLENGSLGEYTSFDCTGTFQVGNKTMKCLHTHNSLDLKNALAKSCNIYFYRALSAVGYNDIIDMARRFGIGTASGFGDPKVLGLGGESSSIGEQVFPPRRDKKQPPAYQLQTAIGHGEFENITPLQVATFIAPFANYGNRVTPYIVDRIGESEAKRTPPARIGLKTSTIDIVRRGMEMVCDPGGTAGPAEGIDLRPYKVAGKTGTPQESKTVDHAWFAGYFPYDHPRLVFAVYQEDTELGGGKTCRPILNALLQQSEIEGYLK